VAGSAAGRAPRVVVVNDDSVFLELMQALLTETRGHEVLVRKHWDGAYQFVKETRPDLVILDIVMGGEERGWAILNLLTLDPETLPIPVLVCSAAVLSLQDHQDVLDRYGILALPKPFDLDALLAAVDALLTTHRAPGS
jgi:DNA-binding response OmpR family regulator